MNKKLINTLLFGALAGVSQIGSAAISTQTKIDFTGAVSSYFGKANLAPEGDGSCTENCWLEKGMVVGTVLDTFESGAHLHALGSGTVVNFGYHNDSAGIYVRADDSSAFSLEKFRLESPASLENPNANGSYTYYDEDLEEDVIVDAVAGPDDVWEIYGYSSALNETLDTDTNSGNWIVKKTVTNGSTGNVLFDDDALWQNISAFWIHYKGYQQTPDNGQVFQMKLDNIYVNAPVTVPVPAAVWMFGTGLIGLVSFGRKKPV